MGRFDTTARRVAKRDPVGFFRWILSRLAATLAFARWLDARTAPRPSERELTCDALAEFLDAARPEAPWIVVAEFQTEPAEDDLERLLEYMLRFRREHRPRADPRLKYQVAGLVLNLTGPAQAGTLAMPLPGQPECDLVGRVARLAVRELDAAATLTGVASGALSRGVLPWVALMRGNATPANLEEWKRLAELEPDRQLRLDYAAEALVFAELSDGQAQWKNALEGWNVRESQQVLEWQAEAKAKGMADGKAEAVVANLQRVLEKRFKTSVPNDLAAVIQATKDTEVLSRWFDASLDATSLEEFRAAVLAGR